MISRHGARYPTPGKDRKYRDLLEKIKNGATLTGNAAFLKDYQYNLGTESLVPFGEQEMVNAGIHFYQRYPDLSSENEPFIRTTSSQRVKKSAEKFIQGFQFSREQTSTRLNAPTIGTVISNEAGHNNTLNHNTCPRFEATYNHFKHEGMDAYVEAMMPSIRDRLNTVIQDVVFSDTEILELMELCAFDTVAATDDASKESPFCRLFTKAEWTHYEYSQSLAKWYAFGKGNPLFTPV
jgi:3-phytase